MSEVHVPMIPCDAAGPLGVRHLPRLWLKVSLEARGKLAPGYPGIGKGFDTIVITGLGLNPEAVRAFIKDNKPTYAQFEAWVKSQPGVKLDRANIEKINTTVLGYHHDDATRKEILDGAGYPDDGAVHGTAIVLNALDDWTAFHTRVLK